MSFADISDLALVMLIIVGSILFVLFIGCILLEFLWEIEHPPRVEYSDNMTEKSAGVFMYQNYYPRSGPDSITNLNSCIITESGNISRT